METKEGLLDVSAVETKTRGTMLFAVAAMAIVSGAIALYRYFRRRGSEDIADEPVEQ